MNEELQDTANEVLKGLIDNAASMKDFILSEAPEVIQQLLMWDLTESIIGCLFSILTIISALIPSVLVIRRGIKYEWHDYKNRKCGYDNTSGQTMIVPLSLFCILYDFICIMVFLSFFNLKWLQIWIAPKVYLIEYAAELVK